MSVDRSLSRLQSVIDCFVASEQCMAAMQSLFVLEEASGYSSDRNSLILGGSFCNIG